jgi:hypothetical protein
VAGFVGGWNVAVTGLRIGMNRFQKLMRATLATVIILTVGAVMAAEIEFKVNPNNLPPCPKDLMFKEFQGNCWGAISLAGEIRGGKKITYAQSITYTGELKRGKNGGYVAYGYGMKTYANGDKYVGEFKNGVRQGEGFQKYAAGGYYSGGWENDKRSGLATSVYNNGDYYFGEYQNDSRNGEGTFTTIGGTETTGTWKNGKLVRTKNNNESQLVTRDLKRQLPLPQCNGIDPRIWTDCVGEIEIKSGHLSGTKVKAEWLLGIPKALPSIENAYDEAIEALVRQAVSETMESLNIVNPNNLRLCPQLDAKKKIDLGLKGKTGRWDNCWGTITISNDDFFPIGGTLEGEWRSGFLDGYGKYKNEIGTYSGEWKKGRISGLINFTGSKDFGVNYTAYVSHEIFETLKNGLGVYEFQWNELYGEKYVGEFKDNDKSGIGIALNRLGSRYFGEWVEGKREGRGFLLAYDGTSKQGKWKADKFIQEEAFEFTTKEKNLLKNLEALIEPEYKKVQSEIKQTLDELSAEKKSGSASKNKFELNVTATPPDLEGVFSITVTSKTDLASLKINGAEQGGRNSGAHTFNRIARAGQDTVFNVSATDISGRSTTKSITVSRPLADSPPIVVPLNPAQVKRQPERDAVAIVIGIADYKNLPRADYANDDARVFYDYAIRALGVKPDNIKLLVDADADEVGIYRAFKTWLPSRVRSTTDVYVYYSGHGLPTADGQGLYVLPQRADRDFIDKTAITQAEINAAIQAAKPKSVTIFLDACYSGQARTGETLIASARPVSLKADTRIFPDTFTVITASRAEQISSSSPDLKHGIFSYWLMRGMEGDADANKDGRITAGEMQAYLAENVSRQAGMMNRKQEPQLIGDSARVLVGR